MAKKQFNQILVIDVEATCWEHTTPPDQEQEIIEIGVCVLEVATRERVAKHSLMVKPTRSQISSFCTELTSITPPMAAMGMTFAKACETLRREYGATRSVWASWGNYDRRQFQVQCASFGVPYPFGDEHLNVKTLFALKHQLTNGVGMARALKMLKMPLEGTQHRGVDDAWNIAGILAHLLS